MSNLSQSITNEEFATIRAGTINLVHALCFILGWQGGTVHQVAAALQVSIGDILEAGDQEAGQLCRKAQSIYWKEQKGEINLLIFKHLTVCLDNLKMDYKGHTTPFWLERAIGVHKIMSEMFIL